MSLRGTDDADNFYENEEDGYDIYLNEVMKGRVEEICLGIKYHTGEDSSTKQGLENDLRGFNKKLLSLGYKTKVVFPSGAYYTSNDKHYYVTSFYIYI